MLIKPQNGPPPGAATKGEDDDEGQETGLLLGEGKVDSLPPPPDGKLVRVDSKVIKAERDVAGSGRGKPVSAKGIFLLLLSKIAGCGHIVTTRLLLREALFEPAALAVLRNVVTILFLGSILLCKRDLRTNLGTICKEVFAFWRQVVVGALGTFVLQTFVMQSLNLIPATNLAVLSQLSPPFLFVIAGFILKTETPSWTKFLGMMAAVGGAVVIIDPTHFKASDVGNLLCVGMALAYAIIVTVQKHVVRAIPAAALQFTFTAYAIPFFVLLAAGLGQIRGIRLTPYSAGLATVVGVCASLDYYFGEWLLLPRQCNSADQRRVVTT